LLLWALKTLGIFLQRVANLLPDRPSPPIPLAISECLLGKPVRYDGSSARSSYPHTVLEGLFTYIGICPEIGVGMGVPRKPIHLVEGGRVVEVFDQTKDHTDSLVRLGLGISSELSEVAGYVFMEKSPSCGLFKVKTHPLHAGTPKRVGRGVFARTITNIFPDLPVEENIRLNDPVLRENFVMRTFVYAHWQACFGLDYQNSDLMTASRLISFHSRYKYLLMAHSVPHYRRAGGVLSNLKDNLIDRAGQYRSVLMQGLSSPATRGGHTNVLSHLQGYLKGVLEKKEKNELHSLILSYQKGEQPLADVLAVLNDYFINFPSEYVLHQAYLDPCPDYLGLQREL